MAQHTKGERPVATVQYDSVRRFIRNGRDLSQWVHVDVLFHRQLVPTLEHLPDIVSASSDVACAL